MNYGSLIILVVFIAVMYFLMIRPQKKRDKQIQEMRSSLQVGDEIITIGGICGKIVKTKDETIVIQVGADKVKFEMMRWSVSQVVNPSNKRKAASVAYDEDEAPKKKSMPRKLRKAAEAEETAESEKLEQTAAAAEEAEEKAEKAEEMVEQAAEERKEELKEEVAEK